MSSLYHTKKTILNVSVLFSWPWPCSKHNSCLHLNEELSEKKRFCYVIMHGVPYERKTRDCAGSRTFHHKSWRLCLLLWCLPGFIKTFFKKLWCFVFVFCFFYEILLYIDWVFKTSHLERRNVTPWPIKLRACDVWYGELKMWNMEVEQNNSWVARDVIIFENPKLESHQSYYLHQAWKMVNLYLLTTFQRKSMLRLKAGTF